MQRYAVKMAVILELEGEIEVVADSAEDAILIAEWMKEQGELEETLWDGDEVSKEIEIIGATAIPETRSEEVSRESLPGHGYRRTRLG